MGLLSDKVVLITGAAGGIGRAAALDMAMEGAIVVAADLDRSGAADTAELLRGRGHEAAFVSVDIADGVSVREMVGFTIDRYGRLDGAFNNAGIELEHSFTGVFDEEKFDRLIAVNLKGTWLCLKHELEAMAGRAGAIVNTASIAGLFAAPGLPMYSASKHGVVGLTRSLAVEYAKRGIRINAICPAIIRTAMTAAAFAANPQAERAAHAMHPMGRIGEAEEAAALATWLLSDKASFVTGATWTVDGGLSAL